MRDFYSSSEKVNCKEERIWQSIVTYLSNVNNLMIVGCGVVLGLETLRKAGGPNKLRGTGNRKINKRLGTFISTLKYATFLEQNHK